MPFLLLRLPTTHCRSRNGPSEMGIESRLIDIIKERGKGVVITLADGIIFMIVAARTFQSQSEERCAHRVHSIGDIFITKLFLDATAFIGLSMKAVESRS